MFPWHEVLRRTQFCSSPVFAIALIGIVLIPPMASAGDFIPLGAKAKVSESMPFAAAEAESIGCSSPFAITVGDVDFGTNVIGVSNVSHYGCQPWNESGFEVVYLLSIPTPTRIQIDLESDCDLDLALLSGCDATNDCLILSDGGIRSRVPVSGEFYLVVDGFNGAGCLYQLSVREYVPPRANSSVCAEAVSTACGPSTVLQGTTCGDANDLGELECSYSVGYGEDRVYRFSVQPGGFLDATLSMTSADPVLWILGSCGADTECLGFADAGFSGEDEHLRYENSGSSTVDVFVVVDSFAADTCSEYTLSLACSGATVAAESKSWSALKELYGGSLQHEEVHHD